MAGQWTEQRLHSTEASSLWLRILNWGLFLNDYDPLEVFQGSGDADQTKKKQQQHCHSLTKSYQFESPPLSSAAAAAAVIRQQTLLGKSTGLADPNDRAARTRCTRFVKLFLAYFALKAILLSFVTRSLLLYKFKLIEDEPSSSTSDRCFRLELLWFQSEQSVRFVNELVGNPLEPLEDLAILVYQVVSGISFILGVLMPAYYNHISQMNMPSVRFLLKPRLELQRIDALINRTLCDLSRSRANLFDSPRATNPILSGYSNNNNKHTATHATAQSFRDYQLIQDQLVAYQKRPGHFRPDNYSYKSYRRLRESLPQLVGTTLGTFLGGYLSSMAILVYLNYDCSQLNGASDQGRAWPAVACGLSWPDLWVAAELTLDLVLSFQQLSLHVFLLLLVVGDHFTLINSMRATLEACKRRLELLNSAATATATMDDRRWRAPAERDLHELKCTIMLDTLIRLVIFEQEIKILLKCLAEMAAHFFAPIFGQILFSYLTGRLSNTKAHASIVRWATLAFVWISVNSVSLVCSYISARLLKLERFYWSILALNAAASEQLKRHFTDLNPMGPKGSPLQLTAASREQHQLDPVTRMWQKFVLTSHSDSARNRCAILFGAGITYGQLIEFDFFGVFVYSLFQKFPSA